MKRREFFSKSGAAAAASAAAPMIIPRDVLGAPGRPGANDRIQIAIIGLGGRANWLLRYEDFSAVDIVAVSDPWLKRCDDAVNNEGGKKWGGDKWRKYQNYQKMFEKEKLDAVFVETTTHARVLVCMHALQAGLDVYAEKPLTLTVEEGRVLTHAVRKLGRVLQTGTQQRSMPINRYASKLIADGRLGKIHTVLACNFEGPARWPGKPAQKMPDGLDWDMWCNQTELRPYHTELHNRWALWWDYDGGGQSWGVSGWGTHALDQVQCALGTDDTGPVELWPEEPGPKCKVTLRYASGTLLKLAQDKINDHQQLGAIFYGEKGTLQIVRGNFKAEPKELDDELRKDSPPVLPEGAGECAPHLQNFFECIRTRQRPYADVEIGHRSTVICHLVNICRDLGRKLQWDPKAERFIGDDEANQMLSRPRRKGYELPKITA